MHRITDNSLVQVTYLNGEPAIYACQGTKVADMAISADPGARPFRQRSAM